MQYLYMMHNTAVQNRPSNDKFVFSIVRQMDAAAWNTLISINFCLTLEITNTTKN
jgi:hypothetical protein